MQDQLDRIEEILGELVRRLPVATRSQRHRERTRGLLDEFHEAVRKAVLGKTDISMPEVCAAVHEGRAPQGVKMRISSSLKQLGYRKYRQSKSSAGPDGIQRERWELDRESTPVRTLVKRSPQMCAPCKSGNHAGCLKDSRAGEVWGFACQCQGCINLLC